MTMSLGGRMVDRPRTNSPAIWAVAIAIVLLAATLAVFSVAVAQPRPVVPDADPHVALVTMRSQIELLTGRVASLEDKVAKLSHGGGRGATIGSERGAGAPARRSAREPPSP